MSGNRDSLRRYTDREVREILARVGELQVKKTAVDSGSGVTLQQLEQAAAELGLDAELVGKAAREIERNKLDGEGSLLLGGPWNVSSDSIVAGRVTSDNWPSLVEDLRASTGRVGTPAVTGTLFEWTSNQPDGLHVSISPSGEDSRVRVTARFGDVPIFLQYFIGMLGLAIGVMLSLVLSKSQAMSPAVGFSIIAGLAVFGFFLVRVACIPFAAKRNRETRELVAFLEQRIGQVEELSLIPVNVQKDQYVETSS